MPSWWSVLLGRDRRSAQVAKQRLMAVVEHERAARGQPRRPDYLPALQRELAKVVSRYVKVPAGDVQVQMQRRHDSKQVLEVKVRLPQAVR
ncbi:MAG: cell division topological specificity factor MinE [Ideonella sp.]|nr:cell division topological specificity factor MinE [Ideonella sp.]MCC7457641.1 cell division topological specificity factor MinE [Nitrospira sp.]